MEKHQFEFKPFDQVLVRDRKDQEWSADFYSHKGANTHQCVSSNWNEVIPYNEETKHLIGTAKPYTPPQPKTYQVTLIAQNGSNSLQVSYTDDEFKKFIETAVLNNKDVSNFDVRRICG